jgi:hypothetical protein
MNGEHFSDDQNKPSAQELKPLASKHRRVLLKGAPALLLLANRPAFAAGCSISGFTSFSLGTSLTTYDPVLCNGWNPSNWRSNRGTINNNAWSLTGVTRDHKFSNIFSTSKMSINCGIREVINGVPGAFVLVESGIDLSMQRVLEGVVIGGNYAKPITKHAAATCLNSAFINNGGGGTAPDPWMMNYISPADVLGFYLLYERVFLSQQPIAPGVTYRYERNGSIIAQSQNLTDIYYRDFFKSMSDGKSPGSTTWSQG